MRVTVDRGNRRTFKDVEMGKPFILHEFGVDTVYIKTENFNVNMECVYNAICLEDGTFELFKEHDEVQLFNDCQEIILK